MSSERTELRAERLRVALAVLDFLPDYEAGRYPEPRPLLPDADVGLFQTCSQEDRQLAETCLQAERDLRRQEWGAVEALLGAIPPGGNIDSIYELPAEHALPALRHAHACGWLHEAGT
jgi:hypothetical protein